MVKKIAFSGKRPKLRKPIKKESIKELKKEINDLKVWRKIKIEEYNELKERYKAICACHCFTLGTDFD